MRSAQCLMRNRWMRRCLGLAVLLCLLLSACSAGMRLKNISTQRYINEAGYHLTLPADWQLAAEEEESSIFVSPEDDISLTVVGELGGEAYYGLGEITEMLLARLQDDTSLSVQEWQPVRVVTDTDENRRQVFKGEDEDGATVYMDITIMQPYAGIRYYLMFAAGSAAINSQSALIDDIVAGFGVDENVSYLYALMEERREEETAEAEDAKETEDANETEDVPSPDSL